MCFENKYKIKSISLCSSFFLCLQGQPELCGIYLELCGGIYHLLQSCFSFIVRLHGQMSSLVGPSFSSFAVLSSSLSTANQSCLLATSFSSLKPGSQYNVNVTLRQEVIQFSMGLVAGIEMISIPATVAATNQLKIV